MHDQSDQERPMEAIEEMPAAPEADQGVRDADAPTWSPPTEGHLDRPISTALADAEADALTTAAALADLGPDAPPPDAPALDAPADAPPERIAGDRIEVNQGGANRIEGREVTVNQGGAAIIRGDRIRVDQGGAAVIVARRVEIREGGAFLLLARRVEGQMNVALDWRGLAAIFAGIIAILVVRGRR